jgi:hypothetical protein
VNGRAEATFPNGMRLNPLAGMGLLLQEGEGCKLASATGAVILTIAADQLAADPCGISQPGRVMDQQWSSFESNYKSTRSSYLGRFRMLEGLLPYILIATSEVYGDDVFAQMAMRLGFQERNQPCSREDGRIRIAISSAGAVTWNGGALAAGHAAEEIHDKRLDI